MDIDTLGDLSDMMPTGDSPYAIAGMIGVLIAMGIFVACETFGEKPSVIHYDPSKLRLFEEQLVLGDNVRVMPLDPREVMPPDSKLTCQYCE